MAGNLIPDTVIPSIPSPQTITISTFSSPRPAPPPIVVPLFATTVRPSRRTLLALHVDLDPKPRLYRPYSQAKRFVKSPAPRKATARSATPPDSEPVSPLTPIHEEPLADASSRRTETRDHPVPPPSGKLDVAALELEPALAKRYRVRIFFPPVNASCSDNCSSFTRDKRFLLIS